MEQLERALIDGHYDVVANAATEAIEMENWGRAYDIAQAYIAYGFFEEAVELYRTLRKQLPEEEQLKIDEAQTLIELGKEDEALLLLKEVDSKSEVYLQVLLIEADYYSMLGMEEIVMQKVEEAYKRAPEEPIIQFAYAEAALSIGRNREAIRMYERLQENGYEEMGTVTIAHRLAEAYRAGGAYEEAIPYFEEVVGEEENPADVFNLAYVQLQSGHTERAVPLFQQVLEMDPDYYAAYYALGHAYTLLERNEEAYATYEAGIRRDAYNKELYVAIGKVALKIGKENEAVEYLQEALALDPEYLDALITLTGIYERQENDTSLIDVLSSPHVLLTPDLTFALARAYNRQEMYDKAREQFEKVAPILEDDVPFLNAYATFLREDGDRIQALHVAKRLVTLDETAYDWQEWIDREELYNE